VYQPPVVYWGRLGVFPWLMGKEEAGRGMVRERRGSWGGVGGGAHPGLQQVLVEKVCEQVEFVTKMQKLLQAQCAMQVTHNLPTHPPHYPHYAPCSSLLSLNLSSLCSLLALPSLTSPLRSLRCLPSLFCLLFFLPSLSCRLASRPSTGTWSRCWCSRRGLTSHRTFPTWRCRTSSKVSSSSHAHLQK